MTIISLCKSVVDSPFYHLTPLQHDECHQLINSDARGDAEEVERLSEQIRSHFRRINRSFDMAIETQSIRFAVAYNMIVTINNEYAPPHLHQSTEVQNFVLSYGDLEQQTQAANAHQDNDLETLARWRRLIEQLSFEELCLDHEYATRRLQATVHHRNLTNELLQARDWNGLLVLLDQDQAVCRKLVPWLHRIIGMQTPGCKDAWLSAATELIEAHIAYLRSIADNPPDQSDPPPPYSIIDPNVARHLPARGIFSSMGANGILHNLGRIFDWRTGS